MPSRQPAGRRRYAVWARYRNRLWRQIEHELPYLTLLSATGSSRLDAV